LLSLHKEIRARSELRVKIDRAIDEGYTEELVHAGFHGSQAIAAVTENTCPASAHRSRTKTGSFVKR